MIKQKILVPLDTSPISAHTRERLFAMKQHLNPPLVLLHVLDLNLLATQGFPEKSHAEFSQRARTEAENFLQEQKSLFAAEGIEVETLVETGPALETICQHADSGNYELVAIGRNPVSEIRDLLFGQISNKLIHKVRCPVLVL